MKILFENTYTRDKATVKDMCRFLCFRHPIFYLSVAVFLILSACGILSAAIHHAVDADELILFICAVLTLATPIGAYLSQVRGILKTDRETIGKAPQIKVAVTDTCVFDPQSTDTSSRFYFTEIVSAISTKRLIVLKTKDKSMLLLHKNAFTLGTADAFLTFLKSKKIPVKG